MRAGTLFTIVALAALAACSRPAATHCRTPAECGALDGKRVTVVGIYRALPHPKGVLRGDTQPTLARVDLGGGEGPYLEPFYRPAARRDDAETTRFVGKRVRVTGVYHPVQPRNPADPPYAQTIGGSCIADIEEITLAPFD